MVVCGLCSKRTTLAQVEYGAGGELFWHVMWRHKPARFAVDGGFPPNQKVLHSNYAILSVVDELPAAFRIRCPNHITAWKDRDFSDLMIAVRKAVADRGRVVIKYPIPAAPL